MAIPPLQIGDYRFAPTLWPSLAFLVLFPFLLSLGFWQLDRAGVKRDLDAQKDSNAKAAALALHAGMRLDEDQRYRAAAVEGRYLEAPQWLLDNRIYRGQAGYHVFTPFVLSGDVVPSLLVNRGWISVGESRKLLPALPVPGGPLRLSGRLDSPASVALIIGKVPLDSAADTVVVQSLDIAALASVRGLDLLRYALVLDEAQPGGLQYDWVPGPSMGADKHLGYAVQWFGLSLALLIIYLGVNTRKHGGDSERHAEA